MGRVAVKKLCRFAFTTILLVALSGAQQPAPAPDAPRRPVHFLPMDVIVDSGDAPLAAYQVEVWAPDAEVMLVGLEGGEHAAFAEPPYYDPVAKERYHERLIVAAFNTASTLPAGPTRVARLHLAVVGAAEPRLVVKLATAATSDGTPIEATATVTPAKGGRG